MIDEQEVAAELEEADEQGHESHGSDILEEVAVRALVTVEEKRVLLAVFIRSGVQRWIFHLPVQQNPLHTEGSIQSPHCLSESC